MHVVVVLLDRVAAEIDVGEIEVADIRSKRDEVLDGLETEAEGAASEGGVAPAGLLRCRLQHRHAGAHLPCLQRGVGRRIAGADYQHVDAAEVSSRAHSEFPSALWLRSFLLRTATASAVLMACDRHPSVRIFARSPTFSSSSNFSIIPSTRVASAGSSARLVQSRN